MSNYVFPSLLSKDEYVKADSTMTPKQQADNDAQYKKMQEEFNAAYPDGYRQTVTLLTVEQDSTNPKACYLILDGLKGQMAKILPSGRKGDSKQQIETLLNLNLFQARSMSMACGGSLGSIELVVRFVCKGDSFKDGKNTGYFQSPQLRLEREGRFVPNQEFTACIREAMRGGLQAQMSGVQQNSNVVFTNTPIASDEIEA